MSKDDLISVVIPMTRYVEPLEEAIESVFAQTWKKIELVLVDNGAVPEAIDIANRWRSRFEDSVKIVSEEKRGAASARSRGIRESRGEYVALLDSDDRMKPERLEIQLEVLKRKPSISLVGSWEDEIDEKGALRSKDLKPQCPRWADYLFGDQLRFQRDPLFEPQTSTFFFKKEVAASIGFFDSDFDPFWLEDTDFVFRMYETGPVYIVPQSLVEFRVHNTEDALKRIFDFGQIQKHDLFFSKLKEKYFDPEDRKSIARFRKLQSRWLRETAIKFLYLEKGEEVGQSLIRRALNENPKNEPLAKMD